VRRIVWTELARADVRRLDRPTAMRVLAALHRFAESGEGDVKAVSGREELRLRVGDYRLFFVSAARLTPSRFVACFIAAMLVGERRAARKKKNLTQRAQRTRREGKKSATALEIARGRGRSFCEDAWVEVLRLS
jgi:mRNA interferase RelE/StbE